MDILRFGTNGTDEETPKFRFAAFSLQISAIAVIVMPPLTQINIDIFAAGV